MSNTSKITSSVKKIGVGILGFIAALGALIALSSGTAAAEFAEQGEVTSRQATLISEDAVSGVAAPGAVSGRANARISGANDSGLMSAIAAHILESDIAIPPVCAPTAGDATGVSGTPGAYTTLTAVSAACKG